MKFRTTIRICRLNAVVFAALCTVSFAAGAAVLRPWSQAGWASLGAEAFFSYVLTIDSIEQYRVPFGDSTVEVNMIYRAAEIDVMLAR